MVGKLRKWEEQVISVWHHHEEMFLKRQIDLHLLESKKEADRKNNVNRLQILYCKCDSEMGLCSIVYLRDNELWMVGSWHWLEQHLMWREMIRWEKQKHREKSARIYRVNDAINVLLDIRLPPYKPKNL